jgi:hypothetical protein
MYRKKMPGQLKMEIPFNIGLNHESKWVKLAKQIPWDKIEEEYSTNFESREGQIAKPSRLAYGALYIQAAEGFTDEKTREHIRENPHMQYFCGFDEYSPEPPFDASMMVHFRKRIPSEVIIRLTEEIFVTDALERTDAPEPEEHETEETEGTGDACDDNGTETEAPASNRGTLILDATCCPQDIRYPTDIGLMNHARELSEEIIDRLYNCIPERYDYKPRTYRQVARKDYLAYAKTRRPGLKMIRKHLRRQLQYLSRNLRTIENLVTKGAPLSVLPRQLYRKLLVINEAYRQQREMYDSQTNRCEGRIVSLSQPHLRPIVRGKDYSPTEFGSKVAIGLVGGYAFITDISWENMAEASLLTQAAEDYRRLFGFYPKTIIGDGVYPNRDNRSWCKQRFIRLSGPALGRKSEDIKREEARQQYKDGCERNAVEGMFGVTKRKFSLARIMPKLPETSLTAVAMGFFVANMERRLRLLFSPFSDCYVFYDFELLRLGISEI